MEKKGQRKEEMWVGRMQQVKKQYMDILFVLFL